MKTKFKKYLGSALLLTLAAIYACLPRLTAHAAALIENLESIGTSNSRIKSLRDDVRKSIYVIKSGKEASELPELKFFRYRIRQGETFWIILTKTSLNIDTLMTVNSLSSPGEAEPGRVLYIPNMRGIIHRIRNNESIYEIARKYQVNEKYISRINPAASPSGEFLFVPCGGLTNLERSLFLGTGFSNPLRTGRISSGFGKRRDPFSDRFQFHRGIDIACSRGSKVHAARSGRIVFSGYNGGYGLLVVIQHAHDYLSYYGHLSKVIRKTGETVSTGDIIALSGNTGVTTGPHLHFEVRKGSAAVNPGILFK